MTTLLFTLPWCMRLMRRWCLSVRASNSATTSAALSAAFSAAAEASAASSVSRFSTRPLAMARSASTSIQFDSRSTTLLASTYCRASVSSASPCSTAAPGMPVSSFASFSATRSR